MTCLLEVGKAAVADEQTIVLDEALGRVVGRQNDLEHRLDLPRRLGHVFRVARRRVLGVWFREVNKTRLDGLNIEQNLLGANLLKRARLYDRLREPRHDEAGRLVRKVANVLFRVDARAHALCHLLDAADQIDNVRRAAGHVVEVAPRRLEDRRKGRVARRLQLAQDVRNALRHDGRKSLPLVLE